MTDCYYKSDECTSHVWECLTCNEMFCSTHTHTTVGGTDVECVACERERFDHAQEEAQLQEPECYPDCDDEDCSLSH